MRPNALVHMALVTSLWLGILLPVRADGKPDPSPWTFDPILRLLGADLGVGYRGLSLIPGDQTTFWVYAGGGYEGEHYYRDAVGNLLSPGQIGSGGGTLANADPAFNRIEAAWRLGIEQGFVWNPRTATNLLEAFFFYRGRYDLNLPASGALVTTPSLTVLPDRDTSILNTLQFGLGYDDMLTDLHRTRNGTSAEMTAEWGPPWFFNTIQGDSDFVRFNGNFTWFLRLYDAAPENRLNLFSVYLGEYFSVDYAVGLNGTPVPLYIRQTFGGRTQNTGLGDQVRGVDKGAYDTNLKAVNNLEVRANLLAIPMPDFVAGFVPDIVPGVLAYFDCGFYGQVGEPGISSPLSGFVAATGAGVYVEVPSVGTLLAFVEYRLDKENAAGDRLRVFVLEFGMQF
ncbi:MAG: hypothetical protein ABSG21_14270 [Spirochaetia bacterium]